MSAHPATELLSAYLDRELVARERLAVEAHIEECHRCQHRLEGLRRVVAHLQEVPTSRPPMTLAHSVETHVARALRERRLRPGRTLRGIALPHPAVGLGFALTVGLAIVLVLFTQLAPRGGDDRSRVILTPSSSAPGLPDGQAVIAGDRRFVLRGGVFVQGGLAAAAVEAAATLAPDAAAEVLASHPWLDELLALGRDVVFETDGGETVRLATRAAAPEKLSGS